MSEIFTQGEKYFIRCVTHYCVGKLVDQDKKFLVLKNASWIPETGRFHDCLKDGFFEEVEPYVNDVIVAKGAIVDATIWKHDLPKDQK